MLSTVLFEGSTSPKYFRFDRNAHRDVCITGNTFIGVFFCRLGNHSIASAVQALMRHTNQLLIEYKGVTVKIVKHETMTTVAYNNGRTRSCPVTKSYEVQCRQMDFVGFSSLIGLDKLVKELVSEYVEVMEGVSDVVR